MIRLEPRELIPEFYFSTFLPDTAGNCRELPGTVPVCERGGVPVMQRSRIGEMIMVLM